MTVCKLMNPVEIYSRRELNIVCAR